MVNLAYVRNRVAKLNELNPHLSIPIINCLKISIQQEVLRAVSEGCPLASLLAKEVLRLK